MKERETLLDFEEQLRVNHERAVKLDASSEVAYTRAEAELQVAHKRASKLEVELQSSNERASRAVSLPRDGEEEGG